MSERFVEQTWVSWLCYYKGNHTIADLRYGLEDSISPITLVFFSAIKGQFGIHSLHNSPEVL